MRAICKFSLTLAATTILPLLAIGVSLMGSPALEKVDSRRHGLGRARQNATAPTMAMPFVAPLFLQDSQFSSTLSLVNASRLHTYATVTVRSLDGQTILERQVPLAPSSPAQVDVQQLLLEANSAETRGSIIIEQSSDLKGMAVLAQLSITYQGSRASYIDEELAMPNPTMGSSILRGVVRGHSDSALVAISSLSQTPQKVEVDCLGQGNPMSKMVDLAPNATVITNACDKGDLGSQPLTDIREEESSNGASPVGIQLSSNAGPAQFAAFGLTRHLAGGELFLGAIPFNDPKTAVSSSTVFAGLPVGAAEILGSGPYEPYLAVANFSLLPAHVTVSFSQTSGAPGAATASNNMVAHIRLQPQNTKIVSFADLQGDPDMRNSFVVTSDGAPGDIAVSMASKDLRGQAEVELLGKDAQQHENAGVHPWSLDSGDDPILLLFNHTDQPQRVIINILDGGSLWKKTVKLAPSETLQMHIADLIRNQVSDDSRRTLPKNLTQGQVNWIMDGLHTVTGRVLLSNAQTFMARNFSCAAYNVLCGASISPYGPTMNIGDSLYFHGTPIGCVGYTEYSCSGSSSSDPSVSDYGWSGNYVYIPASCSGLNSCSVSAESSGTGNVTVQITATNGCLYQASTPVTIPPPPSATISQNTSGPPSANDTAGGNYQAATGVTNLGPFTNLGKFNGCGIGFETVGTITPSNYTSPITIHRTISSQGLYVNSTEDTADEKPPGFDDTGGSLFLDTNPQPGGAVYGVDAPGEHPPSIDGNVYRYRTNFYSWAALPSVGGLPGSAISSNYNFYVRLSCQQVGPGYVFVNDVPGDNQIGQGTTKTTWNLQ